MSKKTQVSVIFPLNKGLDLTSIPGSQDSRSLTKAKNIVLRSKPSLRKKPGARRLEYSGEDSGIKIAIQLFGTVGGQQVSEILRVRNGRVEVLREIGQSFEDLGVQLDPTDVISIEKYVNAVIINSENSPPLKYVIGNDVLTDFPIIQSHRESPPGFARAHNSRLWYGGRPERPHDLIASAPGNPFDYSLFGGGFLIRVRDGDNDPVGLTGLSPTFRGDMYAYKWNAVYRVYRGEFSYGVDVVSDEVGSVNHNSIVMTQNDVYSVATDGIHSLVVTDKYGAAEEYTVTYPIYEFFQDDVNWNNAKNMIAAYDKPRNTYLLSYTSSSSAVNDKVLGFNTVTKEFFTYEDTEIPVVGKYFDFGRQTIFLCTEDDGFLIQDDKESTFSGNPINVEMATGVIFPLKSPKAVVNFTQCWILAKPTTKDVYIDVSYEVDGKIVDTVKLNLIGDSEEGSLIDKENGGLIGVDPIGKMDVDMVKPHFEMKGEGSSVRFLISHTPPEEDPDQELELYGIVYEFDYDEDTQSTISI